MSGKATQLAPAIVSVLWLDDKPETVRPFKQLLDKERNRTGIDIDIATSIERARELLKTDAYDALVVDLRMDDFDLSSSGAEFLLEVNKTNKCLPTFVCSSFLDDATYLDDLGRSYAIQIASKNDRFDRPLMKAPFFEAIYKAAESYQRVKAFKPEQISFTAYMKDPSRYAIQTDTHWQKHRHWITTEMARRGFKWAVVCGNKVVIGDNDTFRFPTEDELIDIGTRENLIPFAYSRPLLPEDTSVGVSGSTGWNSMGSDDHYPTIKATVGKLVLEDDFDTGAGCTFVSDAIVRKGPLNFWRDLDGVHLGKSYRYFVKREQLDLWDLGGTTQTSEVMITVVKDWDNSPFVEVNKNRRILFGRDVLRAFKVEVHLDSLNHVTWVRFLGITP